MVANPQAGFKIIEVSDPYNPKIVASVETE